MKSVGYCHSEERSDVGIRSLRLVDENNGLPRRPIGLLAMTRPFSLFRFKIYGKFLCFSNIDTTNSQTGPHCATIHFTMGWEVSQGGININLELTRE